MRLRTDLAVEAREIAGEHIGGVDHLLLEVSASRGKVFLKSAEVY